MSGIAEFGAGVTGPDAERLLGERGFSLGHFPQSFEYATIGGFAATRSSGQDSAGYGRFNDMILRAALDHPGRACWIWAGWRRRRRARTCASWRSARKAPSASSPRCGCGCTALPETTRYEAWSFPDFATGAAALRAITQIGTGPTVVRLSDEAETGVNLATTEAIGENQITGGCLGLTLFEGTKEHAESRHAETRALLEAHGGTSLGEGRRKAWEHGRFAAPYLRDSLLAAGALCETLETATDWSNIAALKAAVTEALTDVTGRVGHAGAGDVPRVARLPDRRIAVLHRGRRPARQSDRTVEGRQEGRIATRSWPPAEPSPTTTRSAPTTGPGCATRWAIWVCSCCARSRRPWTRPEFSIPAS